MSQFELFDYSTLAADFQSPEIIQSLENSAISIEAHAKTTVESILAMGKELNRSRSYFGENDKAFGQWRQGRLPWLHRNVALNYMRIESRFGSENLLHQISAVKELAFSTLSELAAPSTPDEVIEQVIEKAESGETVTAKQVKELKAKLREKEGEINQLKQSNQFVSAELKKQQELMVGIEATLQDSAKSLAEKMTEGEVKKATADLRNELTQLKAEKQRLESAKALADSQLQEAKESYEKALEKFKKNPDPDTQKKLDALQAEYNQMQSNVTQAAYKLEKLREKEDQALSASIELERFFSGFNKLIANHPDAITAMNSRYLTESSLAKLEALAQTLEEWAGTIRNSIALARSDNATAIRAVEVEVIDDEDDF